MRIDSDARSSIGRVNACSSFLRSRRHRFFGTSRNSVRSAPSGHRLNVEALEARQLLVVDSLVISEFLADNETALLDDDNEPSDWVEIHNPTEGSLSLAGWHLTDDRDDLMKWRFPAMPLAPGEHLVVFASSKDRATVGAPLHTNFRLDAAGDYLALVEPDGQTIASDFAPQYPPQLDDVSFGLSADGVSEGYFLTPTPGAANTGAPVDDPSTRIVINEIMYHPSNENSAEEFIELYNAGTQSVSLAGWSFGRGVDFTFSDVAIAPNSYLAVAADLTAFTTKYPAITNVVGPWSGQLSNKSEQIELLDENGNRRDRVTYADQGDWSVRAQGPNDRGTRGWVWQSGHDGDGKSLELINPEASNRHGQNWGSSVPDHGTPGRANSIAQSNIAPMILDVGHWPIIPRASDPVSVSARLLDDHGAIASATLFWRVDGTDRFTNTVMLDRGQFGDERAGDSVYVASIPAQPDETVIEFYVGAVDTEGNGRTWPAPTHPSGQQDANALYMVDDSFDPDAAWEPGSPVVYHQIMTAAERQTFTRIARASDAQLNATFISQTGAGIDLRYNAGIRIRGSGSRNNNPPNNRINIPSDRPWQGVTALNINAVAPQNQIAGSVLFRLAGLPAAEAIGVTMLSNGQNLYGQRLYAHLEPLNSDFARNQFPRDDGGNLYKGRRPNESPPGGRGAGLAYFGEDPAPYVSYIKLTNAGAADWNDVIELTSRLNNAPDEDYLAQVSEVADIDQWLRFFAMNALLDNTEGGLVNGDPAGDDYAMYRGNDETRFRMIPHDLDSLFNQVNRNFLRAMGNPALNRFFRHPEIRQRYYAQLVDLIENTLLTDEASAALDEGLRNLVPQVRIDGIKRFLRDRGNFVISRFPQELTIETSLPRVGGFARSSQPHVQLRGEVAIAQSRSVIVGGQHEAAIDLDGDWSTSTAVDAGTTETIIAERQAWRYLDDGSDQGTAWREMSFNDSGWNSGNGVLGYGDNEATVVSFVDTTPNNPGSVTKNATTYFRRTFSIADPSDISALAIRMRYDDAAAVYINGVQAVRTDNLPENAAFDTYATSGAPNENIFFDFEVEPAVVNTLVAGQNTIAAEIHQRGPTSSDIKFDLEMTATRGATTAEGIRMNPGINRILVEAFDGPHGTGNLVDRRSIDVWYDGPALDTSSLLPAPQVERLELAVRDTYIEGVPILVRVDARDMEGKVQRDLWDAVVQLSTKDPRISLSTNQIQLYNGSGSQLVSVTGADDFTLTARWGNHEVSRHVKRADVGQVNRVSGTLQGESTQWSGTVVVSDDLTVPRNHTLSIAPGTLVLLDGDPVGATNSASIRVLGTLQSRGTIEKPITFTALETENPWGQFDLDGGSAFFAHTFVHRAGNATRMGHTNTGAAVRLQNDAVFQFSNGGITDLHGKIMQSQSGEVTFQNAMLARAVMGPEIRNTSLQFVDSWIVEMAGIYHYDGRVDDNDGIYLRSQRAGQSIELRGGVVANTQDDGIDTLGSDVTVTDFVVRDVTDKAVSVFDGQVNIDRGLLVNADIGVNTKGAGSSRPHTIIDRTTIGNVNTGLFAEDKDAPDPDVVVTYDVSNSIIATRTGGDAVRTDYDPRDIHIRYSSVGENWNGEGNIQSDPIFASPNTGDFRLQPGSPSINAADPSIDLDIDGTRADQGYYTGGATGVLAASTMAGTLNQDVVLTPYGGPYHITGDLIVPPGRRMTILPGTSLYFDLDAELRVEGSLDARGAPHQRIRFTSDPNAPLAPDRPTANTRGLPNGPPRWDGIHFVNSMSPLNIISYADIEYAQDENGSIGILDSQAVVDNVTFGGTHLRMIFADNASAIIRNSTFPDMFATGESPAALRLDNISEHVKVTGRIPSDGRFIIQNNIFGTNKGHNDVIDADGGRRPGPVLQILDNIFSGSGDELIDLGGDAYVAGNLFRNVFKDDETSDRGYANAISTGDAGAGTTIVVARNTFHEVDHAINLKRSAATIFENNTVVGIHGDFSDRFNNLNVGSAINFFVDEPLATAGDGAYVAGNIFLDLPRIFGNADLPEGTLTSIQLNDNLIDPQLVGSSVADRPGTILDFGVGNVFGSAAFLDPEIGDFTLVSGPGVHGGPLGRNLGSDVPQGAWIAGEPFAVTSDRNATLTVGGPGIFAYRYRLNGGPWSDVLSIGNGFDRAGNTVRTSQITLSDLRDGLYTVEVIGQDFAGEWQQRPTASETWRVSAEHLPLPRPVISEILAENRTVMDNVGVRPDLIELHNAGDGIANLRGMSLSDNPNDPTKFVFARDVLIGPGGFLTLLADKESSGEGIHLGFSLRRGGEGVYLYDAEQTLVDSVEFGPQIPDLSIGRVNDQWVLTSPTFGAPNVAVATDGVSDLKINEWLADGERLLNDDFIELYNPGPLPVALEGLYLTDELGGAPAMHRMAPLSFLDANGHLALTADGNDQQGPDHLNFSLSSEQELLALLDTELTPIDRVAYYPQATDVSQGRAPDGATATGFFTLPSPGGANAHVGQDTRETILNFDSVWRYEDSGTDLGESWRQPGFNASLWSFGPGPLGVEGEPLPVALNTEITLGATTFYFKNAFQIDADPRDVVLELTTQIDDGAVVYVNGQEAFRLGMPEGTIRDSTIANRFVNEAGLEGPFQIPSSLLVRGTNLIDVEVHQGDRGLTDIVFGLQLDAVVTSEDPSQDAQALLDGLRVTEIMYNPQDDRPLEFIELRNVSEATLNLDGVRVRDGIDFAFSAIQLLPGEYIVVVQDLEAFRSSYGPSVPVAGQYGRTTDQYRLSNAGERLRIEDSLGRTIQEFSYNDGQNWPGRADGSGSSLEVISTSGDYDDGDNWRSSPQYGGTPGTAATARIVDVVVNEVLAHTDPPLVDAIELRNVSNQAVDIGGWFLSDSNADFKKYMIPEGTVIPAGGYAVFDESEFNPSDDGAGGFALSSSRGDDVWLLQADASGNLLRFADHAEFGATESGVSVGRSPNGSGRLFPMDRVTLGSDNSGPKVGGVIVTELHYHPVDPDGVGPILSSDFEFVELYNRTASAVDLTNWRFAGAIDLTFDQGTVLGPREVLVAVPFDPTNVEQLELFRLSFNVGDDVRLVGPFSGRLDNRGETLRLERPDTPPPDDPTVIPYILVDRIGYESQSPWPLEANGLGRSLERQSTTAFGDLADSWSAQSPVPGLVDLFQRQAGDANEDGQFDQFDIISILQGARYLAGPPASWMQGDFNADNRFDQKDVIAALQTGNYLQGPYASLFPQSWDETELEAAVDAVFRAV